MKFKKLPTITLAAAGFAALAAAPAVEACEDCLQTGSGYTCWSGLEYGVQSCWGGGDCYCETVGVCDDPSLGAGCDSSWQYCDRDAWHDYLCVFWCAC